jgi:hypothetical protein
MKDVHRGAVPQGGKWLDKQSRSILTDEEQVYPYRVLKTMSTAKTVKLR